MHWCISTLQDSLSPHKDDLYLVVMVEEAVQEEGLQS